jgi:hypothetical protein
LCTFETIRDNLPVDLREESVYVAALPLHAVIEEVRVLPYVEREDHGESGEVSLMLLAREASE